MEKVMFLEDWREEESARVTSATSSYYSEREKY